MNWLTCSIPEKKEPNELDGQGSYLIASETMERVARVTSSLRQCLEPWPLQILKFG